MHTFTSLLSGFIVDDVFRCSFYRNANWIETSTQFVPATGNQSATDAGTAAVSRKWSSEVPSAQIYW